MPSHSEGWGGLFRVEQYRLIRTAPRASIRWLRDFEQTTPGAARPPLLTMEGNRAEPPTTINITPNARQTWLSHSRLNLY
jgi:hypothetical protein